MHFKNTDLVKSTLVEAYKPFNPASPSYCSSIYAS